MRKAVRRYDRYVRPAAVYQHRGRSTNELSGVRPETESFRMHDRGVGVKDAPLCRSLQHTVTRD